MKTKPWYIGERAQALSVVYLTRIPEIQVQQEKYDPVFDLIVEVKQNGISTRRIFGILIKAQEAAIKDPSNKKIKIPKETREHIINNVHIPVCLFFFTLENDEGYYTWIKEPFINEDKLPKLRPSATLSLSKLDSAALERIIGDVNAWYNALFQALAA